MAKLTCLSLMVMWSLMQIISFEGLFAEEVVSSSSTFPRENITTQSTPVAASRISTRLAASHGSNDRKEEKRKDDQIKYNFQTINGQKKKNKNEDEEKKEEQLLFQPSIVDATQFGKKKRGKEEKKEGMTWKRRRHHHHHHRRRKDYERRHNEGTKPNVVYITSTIATIFFVCFVALVIWHFKETNRFCFKTRQNRRNTNNSQLNLTSLRNRRDINDHSSVNRDPFMVHQPPPAYHPPEDQDIKYTATINNGNNPIVTENLSINITSGGLEPHDVRTRETIKQQKGQNTNTGHKIEGDASSPKRFSTILEEETEESLPDHNKTVNSKLDNTDSKSREELEEGLGKREDDDKSDRQQHQEVEYNNENTRNSECCEPVVEAHLVESEGVSSIVCTASDDPPSKLCLIPDDTKCTESHETVIDILTYAECKEIDGIESTDSRNDNAIESKKVQVKTVTTKSDTNSSIRNDHVHDQTKEDKVD